MNVNYLISLIAVIVLVLLAYVGVEAAGLQVLFGIVIPYIAFAFFVAGVILRVLDWARSPVPFRIPSTCGQQKSLPWIKHSKFENPFTTGSVIVRMILEVVLFRSLFPRQVQGIFSQWIRQACLPLLWDRNNRGRGRNSLRQRKQGYS